MAERKKADTLGRWAEAPVYYDIVTGDGRILYANTTQERLLGYDKGALSGQSLDKVYPRDSRLELERLFSEAASGTEVDFVPLAMRRNDRTLVDVAANVSFFEDGDQGLCAHLAKFNISKVVARLKQVERENEVLSSITETARDATWCIEFVEPVDLTAPDREIIRQVFENECFWRYCNDAMARLYRLPRDLDFNEQDVRDVFPRNAENEIFVQELINNNFQLDAAPSLDQSYNGNLVPAENDVRAHILNGQLHRMWGTVRDVSKQKRREQVLLDRAGIALDVLASTPDPIIVVDDDLRIEAANPAVEWCFGWPVEKILGLPLTDFADLDAGILHTLKLTGTGTDGQTLRLRVTCADDRVLDCEVNVAALSSSTRERHLILSMRTEPQATTRYSGGAL